MPNYPLYGYRPLSPLDFNTSRVEAKATDGVLSGYFRRRPETFTPQETDLPEQSGQTIYDMGGPGVTGPMAEFPTPAAPVAPAPTPYQGIRGDQHPANRVGGAVSKAPGDQHPPLAAPSAPLSGGAGTNPPMAGVAGTNPPIAGQGGPLNIDPSSGQPLDITPGASENAAPAEEGFFGDSVFSSVDERSAFLRHMSAGLLSGRTWGEGLGKGMAAHAGYKDRQEHREDQQEFRTEEREAGQDFRSAEAALAHERAKERDDTRYSRDKDLAALRVSNRITTELARGNYIHKDTGERISNPIYDQASGRMYQRQDGELVELDPSKYIREPLGMPGRALVSEKGMRTYHQDLVDHKLGFKKLDRSLKLVDTLKDKSGAERQWNSFTSGVKTIMGMELSEAEMNQRLLSGDYQGMLGAFRKSVVGGGVMTEQDARRVLAYLGDHGGIEAMKNPEIMRAALLKVRSDNYMLYKKSMEQYNYARQAYIDRGVNAPTVEWLDDISPEYKSAPAKGASGKGALAAGPKIGDTQTLSTGRVVTWNGTEYK